jgi:hypothetical protein
MVGFAKVVLDIVVLGGNAELDELVLESARLLKKKMNFTIYNHNAYLQL